MYINQSPQRSRQLVDGPRRFGAVSRLKRLIVVRVATQVWGPNPRNQLKMTRLPIEKDFTDHGETKDFSDSGVWLREGKGFTAPLSPGPWTGLYSTFCGILEMFEDQIWANNGEYENGKTHKQVFKYKPSGGGCLCNVQCDGRMI